MPKSARSLAARATDEQRAVCSQMIADGATYKEVADALSVSQTTVKEWLRDDPGSKVGIARSVRALALGEVGRNFQRLVDIRDDPDTGNREKLEAIKAIDLRAGMPIADEAKTPGITNILNLNVNLAQAGSRAEDIAKRIAHKLGLSDGDIIDAEAVVVGTTGGGGAEDRGGGPVEPAAQGGADPGLRGDPGADTGASEAQPA